MGKSNGSSLGYNFAVLLQTKNVYFYGDTSRFGYKISHFLISHRIKHNFVYTEDYYILSVEKVIDITGPNKILEYLESYKYVFDLCS